MYIFHVICYSEDREKGHMEFTKVREGCIPRKGDSVYCEALGAHLTVSFCEHTDTNELCESTPYVYLEEYYTNLPLETIEKDFTSGEFPWTKT